MRHAMTTLPTHSNPYLGYALLGNYRNALPRYLRPERFEAVRDGMERFVLVEGSVEGAARTHGAGGFDGFGLSHIFEQIGENGARGIFAGLLASARPGARLAYWSVRAPRRCPEGLGRQVRSLADLSLSLFGRDLAWFYSDFVVEEVL
jgi:S-adenosylmethionine-diacylglycerol 3-amino-3-carboxypropyl transferase